MSDTLASSRAGFFEGLKRALKAKRLTYADLAARMGVSEQTVKRLFAEKDCKLSRLMDICAALGLTLDEVAAFAQSEPVEHAQMSPEVERALAEDKSLFAFFILLISNHQPEDIAAIYGLSDSRLFLLMRRLEKLGLLELLEGLKFRLKVKTPITWDRKGPLHSELMRANLVFLGFVFEGLARRDDCHFVSAARFMHPETAEKLKAEVEELNLRYSRLMRLDQLFYPPEDLVGLKWVSALGPFMPKKLFQIEP